MMKFERGVEGLGNALKIFYKPFSGGVSLLEHLLKDSPVFTLK